LLPTEVANRLMQFNPWLTDPDKADYLTGGFLPPEYVHRHIGDIYVRTNRAILIVGPRQAGKSTMVWHLLSQYTPEILFLNMEDPLLRSAKIHPIDLVEHIQGTYPFIKAIFIDEIQHMAEAGLFVKGLVDARLNVPLWVTGSSSFDLLSKTRESLSGRATRRRLLPFSMAELVQHADAPNPLAKRKICEHIVSHQLIFGSYPAVYLCDDIEEKIELLNDFVDALILRDASDLFKIKRVDAFRRLLPLLAGQIGNLVNLSELASICNVDVGTISAYIELLSEGHIVEKLQPFAGGKRREITGTPKIFFIDNGIRNQLLKNFSQDLELRMDRGQLLENWVFSEIHKVLTLQSSLKFWRSKAKAEVDFVIEHVNNVYALEVKFSSITRPKLSRSAWSFVSAYKPEKFAVLNMSLAQTVQIRDIIVEFITPNSLQEWLADIFK
jgi:uncharacterized protein